MELSTREVMHLSERCFAATDFPGGEAKANGLAVWWAEAYEGTGMTTLHELLDELPDLDREAVTLRDSAGGVSVIDGADQPSIVSKPPALDLACAAADRHGVGLSYATIGTDDTSRPFVGHTAYKAARRGYVSLVCYTDGETAVTTVATPAKSHPLVAETELDAPSESHAALANVVASGRYRHRDNPLTQVVFDETNAEGYPVAGQRFLDRLLSRATDSQSDADVEPSFVTVCVDPHHQRHPMGLRQVAEEFVDDAAFDAVYRPEDVHDRVGRLMEEGVEVERELWEDVYECTTGVLAPAFEGSEKGAGFDIN